MKFVVGIILKQLTQKMDI